MFESGDIVLKKRKPYEGPFKYLITRLILFFTTEWWRGEKTSKHYHAEMVYGFDPSLLEFRVVSMQPPKCSIRSMPLRRNIVFRLKLKPPKFNGVFDRYILRKLGQRYDFIKFILCGIDWIFRTTWFTRTFVNPCRDICSEFVARFYEERIGIPCSDLPADSTKPDDIFDFCMSSNLFYIVTEV